MSWLRSAVYKAVEVGGNNHLSRAVRSAADTVVNQAGQAVVGGARLFQDRIGTRNFQSYRLAVKRLEEVSVSCRGIERVQLLRRWLVALKEIDRLNEAVNSEHLDKFSEMEDSPSRPTVVMYYDPDLGGEPMNFRDVFLHSQALEGITLSLDELEPALSSIRKLVENLKRLDGTLTTEENDDAVNSRTALEEQYQAIANKVVTTFGVVESIKNQFSTQQLEDSRKSDGKVKELLDALENIKAEFESIEKPTLESVAPNMREGTPSKGRTSELPPLSPRKHQNPTLELDLASTSRNEASRGISLGFNPIIALPLVRSRSTKVLGTAQLEPLEVLGLDNKKSSDAEAQLSKLKMELELENHSRGNSMEGIIDWEFDEVIDKEPRKSV
ncbi:UNVERIFIED_CONTAM: hypothetical protein Slati_3573600 [Sesamum latifolium]|uniref:Uncharacterized protein n=1 Tax=Sesamum latifolium TaxID=2727402 RepID=A0AAW2TYN4_9LAMI